jgi:hypothetical protein
LDDLIVGAYGADPSGKAITVDITCIGDYATHITRILTVDSKALYL